MSEAPAPEEPPVPDGFVLLPLGRVGREEFTASAGPWYGRDEDGKLVIGFRVLRRHTNPIGLCHGGMLATFADVLMTMSAAYLADPEHDHGLLPTINLSLDYLAPIRLGAWVEGRAEVLRRGSRIAFAQALLTADGAPSVRANGVFSVPQTSAGPKTGELLRTLLRGDEEG